MCTWATVHFKLTVFEKKIFNSSIPPSSIKHTKPKGSWRSTNRNIVDLSPNQSRRRIYDALWLSAEPENRLAQFVSVKDRLTSCHQTAIVLSVGLPGVNKLIDFAGYQSTTGQHALLLPRTIPIESLCVLFKMVFVLSQKGRWKWDERYRRLTFALLKHSVWI